METRSTVKGRGRLWLTAYDAQGNVKARRYAENLVVNAGLAWLAGCLTGDSIGPTLMKYLAVGTGAVAATDVDTLLGNEIETRATCTQSRVTTDASNDTYQVVGTVTMTGTRALTEAGIFNTSTASTATLLCRQVFTVINLVVTDTLAITWKLDFDAA